MLSIIGEKHQLLLPVNNNITETVEFCLTLLSRFDGSKKQEIPKSEMHNLKKKSPEEYLGQLFSTF